RCRDPHGSLRNCSISTLPSDLLPPHRFSSVPVPLRVPSTPLATLSWQDKRMPSTTPSSSDCDPGPEQITLLDGTVAELGQEKNGWSLQINGIRQSHIGPAGADPALAASRWMLAALGADLPQRCAVLGGGLLTLPRVIAARRPGAEQVVLELEPALVRLATDRFGLPEGVDLRLGNAREWLDDPDVTGPASDF